jgi:hypothetical protein
MDDGFEVKYSLNPFSNDSALDLDLDGLTNLEEYYLGTFPHYSDSDNDGYTDLEEIEAGTDPLDYYDTPDYPIRTITTDLSSMSGILIIALVVFSISIFILRIRINQKREGDLT